MAKQAVTATCENSCKKKKGFCALSSYCTKLVLSNVQFLKIEPMNESLFDPEHQNSWALTMSKALIWKGLRLKQSTWPNLEFPGA